MLKKEVRSKMDRIHTEIKNHPFRNGFDQKYAQDYKYCLHLMKRLWSEGLTRAEDLTPAERETLYCFSYWYHDFTTNLGSQYSAHYPMWCNEYFEAVIQMTHRFIETGDFSEFYHLADLGGQRLIKDHKIITFKWIDKDICGIDSPFLPRYIPVNFKLESDPEKIKKQFSSGWYVTQSPEEQQRLIDQWNQHAKPIIDWINANYRKDDDNIVLAPGWSAWESVPNKERAYPKMEF